MVQKNLKSIVRFEPSLTCNNLQISCSKNPAKSIFNDWQIRLCSGIPISIIREKINEVNICKIKGKTAC
jgi:hypothetical protein